MATTDSIKIDPGTTTALPTYDITEDAITKEIPRSALNNSSGTEIGTSSNPIQVSVANTGANSTAVKVDGSAVTQPANVTQVGGTNIVTAGVSGLQAVGGNVASAITDAGNPVKVGGKFNASNITLTDGQRGDNQLDANGFLRTSMATLLSGEDQTNNVFKVEGQFSYTNIASATTTTVKSAAGLLHGIVINTPVASATITLYDNIAGSGTKIGTITLGGTLANDVYGTFVYDIKFGTGLTIVTSGATDITVSYR